MSNTIINAGGLQALFFAEWANYRAMRDEARTKDREEPEEATLASALDSWRQMPQEVRKDLMPEDEDWDSIEEELQDLIREFGPDHKLTDLPEGEIALTDLTTVVVTTTCQATLTEDWTIRVGPAGLRLLAENPSAAVSDLIHRNTLSEFVKVEDVKVDDEQSREFKSFVVDESRG